jgi:hypothetical protein
MWKLDGGDQRRDHYTIPAGQTRSADMWIPWTDCPVHYMDHHSTIVVGNRDLAYFWQSGDTIRFNVQNFFVPSGTGIPGASQAGGGQEVGYSEGSAGPNQLCSRDYRP